MWSLVGRLLLEGFTSALRLVGLLIEMVVAVTVFCALVLVGANIVHDKWPSCPKVDTRRDPNPLDQEYRSNWEPTTSTEWELSKPYEQGRY